MVMTDQAQLAALAGLTPLFVYIMWSDAKNMRIPNIACLMILVVFLATGSWGLPLETFLWRLGHTLIAFFIGWGIFTISSGKVGGGDLKMIIALVPFVPGIHVGFVLILWAIWTLVAVGLFWIARYFLREYDTGFASLGQKKYFPAGVTIAASFLNYLLLVFFGRI
ncbi:MAG: prepilin peptidase [Pseudomonadota bacterium]